ncbi:hypothetical protein [Chromobacterium sp. CV08]|uniref:hypothetical protein n=1 Tax=Chromobacterium sp. CV08 TaxID=3133274 RepID=UPI003DA82AEF
MINNNAPHIALDIKPRRLITAKEILAIGVSDAILASPALADSGYQPNWISINDVEFGALQGTEPIPISWQAYLKAGTPAIVEEYTTLHSDPILLSNRVYTNLSGVGKHFADSIQFSIFNKISWNVITGIEYAGSYSIAPAIAETAATRQETVNPKCDDYEYRDEFSGSTTTTLETQAAAMGKVHIDPSLGGETSMEVRADAEISGEIPANSSVRVMAVQKRQVTKYLYIVPYSFEGYVTVEYPEKVYPQVPPQKSGSPHTHMVARDIGKLGLGTFRDMVEVNVESTLDVEYYCFPAEPLQFG